MTITEAMGLALFIILFALLIVEAGAIGLLVIIRFLEWRKR